MLGQSPTTAFIYKKETDGRVPQTTKPLRQAGPCHGRLPARGWTHPHTFCSLQSRTLLLHPLWGVLRLPKSNSDGVKSQSQSSLHPNRTLPLVLQPPFQAPPHTPQLPLPDPKDPFCNTTSCRYCPLINKTGEILYHTTKWLATAWPKSPAEAPILSMPSPAEIVAYNMLGKPSSDWRIILSIIYRISFWPTRTNQWLTLLPTWSPWTQRWANQHPGVHQSTTLQPTGDLIRNRIERNWTHLLR